jgi:hypothetical protein
LRELPSETVFGTSGVSANLSLEIEDPFRRCSIQKQNTAATSIVKILYFLNRLVDRVGRVAHVFGVQLRNKFLWEQFHFRFFLTVVHFIHIAVFAFELLIMGLVTFFMSVFQIELNNYPHFDLIKDGRLCSTDQHCPGF